MPGRFVGERRAPHARHAGDAAGALAAGNGRAGLRSAVDGRYAAYWASWADTLPTLQARHPHAVADIGLSLSGAIGPLGFKGAWGVGMADVWGVWGYRGSIGSIWF